MGIKKWFMFQMWRVQQIAALISVILLSMNLALLVYPYLNWRGGIFENTYVGIIFLIFIIFLAVWIFSLIWDLRLKMWREQMAVAVERNPYAKEKFYSKEAMLYTLAYLPLLDNLGKEDPKAKEAAKALRDWFRRALETDPALQRELGDLLKFIGQKDESLIDWKNDR